MRFDEVMKAGGNAFEASRALAADLENTDKDGHFHRLYMTPRTRELYEMNRLAEMCAAGVRVVLEVKRALAADEAARAAKSLQ